MTPVPRPVPAGLPGRIRERQDQPPHLGRLLAYSYLYIVAQRWHRAGALGTILLATAAPIISLLVPSTSDILAALSAGWLVAGRTVLSWLEDHQKLQAARIQELYDTRLFQLPWNTALAGREPAPEDVAAAAAHMRDTSPYLDWYSIDLGNTPWPGDVLLCQRMSMIWGRRDHRAYGTTILIVGITWFLLGLAIALARDLSLAEYLIKIFLPSSPALLDCTELARSHWRHAAQRENAEKDIQDVWDAHRGDPAAINPGACRNIQDTAFLLRSHGSRVPNFFYKLRRLATQAAMAAGAAAMRSKPGEENGGIEHAGDREAFNARSGGIDGPDGQA
jgi:SMODS-associating 4TM effector domain